MKRSKKIVASLCSLAMALPTVANVVTMTASAGQVLGETSFTNKALPWHTCESSPAKQDFEFAGKEFHITVKEPVGAEKSKWDLQFRHRNLNFKKGHVYEVSCDIKASRAGMEVCSKIGNTKGDEEYFDLKPEGFVMGPHMGGGGMGWGSPVSLTTSYQTFTGTFTPTQDLESVEWAFHYANDSNGYGGNAKAGDEIFFDNMSIICKTCGDGEWSAEKCDANPANSYGAVNRDYSAAENPEMKVNGKLVNFISVNQIGYYPELSKVATLGDNKGDLLYGASTIDLSGTYTWELVNAASGTVVTSGQTTAAKKDADSADTVCKIDFSDYTTPGRYYLRIKGQDWRSFEFNIGDNIYTDTSHNMLTNALNYFYQNRSGVDIEAKYITSGDKTTLAHEGGHKTDTADIQKIWKNEYLDKSEATSTYASSKLTANGGWYDAGDHGKYVVNGGISVWTLQNMYERATFSEETMAKFADGSGTCVIPESNNKVPDVLDEAAVELDWIAQMKVEASEPTWGKVAEGLYYHKLHDHKWTGLATRPYDYEKEWGTTRIVKPPTFAATLNYAACAAQAARLWEPYNSEKAATYLSTAKEAYQAVQKWWYEAKANEETNENSLYAPMNQAKGGGPYGDNEVRDDIYWAACEIFISASKMADNDAATYQKEVAKYSNAYKVTTRITGGENQGGEGSYTTFNWGNTASAGSMSLALHKDLLSDSEKSTLESSILEAANDYLKTEDEQGYGIPYKYDGPGYTDENNLDKSIVINGYEWGSNSMVINNLMVMAYAYDQSGDKKYLSGVTTGMDYLLGNNPLSFSFVTGYGSYHEKNPHHRYWSYELDKTLPMAPDGVLSGGPNAGLQDPYVRALGFTPGESTNPSQRCFVDSIEAWSTNEVTINWNAPLAWIVEFLQDKDVKYDFSAEGTPTPDDPNEADWGNTDCSKGDTPYDRVDVADAVLLARFLAEDSTATVSAQGKLNADVVGDGALNSDDVAKILKFVARSIDYDAMGTKSK
ncbi:MAG: glycoside hydrolase family 9 protein [Oscillospiraceae bacterium]|nr:glycoside hydrolase family 9 protein [Oscillospiraceae bacterium]